MKCRIADCTLGGVVYATDAGFVDGAYSYCFRTPDAPTFEVAVKALALRRKVAFLLLDSRSEEREEINFGATPWTRQQPGLDLLSPQETD